MTYLDKDQVLAALDREILIEALEAAHDVAPLSEREAFWTCLKIVRAQDIIAALPAIPLDATVQAAIEKLSELPAQLDHEELDGLGNQVNDAIAILRGALPVLETKKEDS